jgi:four helix bundle protein
MSNVAEGLARKTDKDFAHFLDIAKGSAVEAQSLLYVAMDVGYLDNAAFQRLFKLADETIALIGGFTSYLRRQAKLRNSD